MAVILAQTASGISNLASTTVTFTNPNTQGNTIIVCVGDSAVTAGDVSGITDTNGNVYHKILATDNSSVGELEIWYAFNVAAGANTITVAYTTGVACAAIAREYWGLWIPSQTPLDQSTSATGNSSSLSSGNVALKQPIELLIGGAVVPLANTVTAGNGYGNLISVGAPAVVLVAMEDQFTTSGGLQTATLTPNASVQWVCGIATFFQAPAGTTTSTSSTSISSTSTSISSTSTSSTSSSTSSTSSSTSISSTSTSLSSTSSSISSTSSSTSSTSISSTSSSTSISSTSTSISSTSTSSTSISSTSSSTSISSTSSSFSSTSSSVSSTSHSTSSTSFSSTSSSSSTSTTTLPYINYSYTDINPNNFAAPTDNFAGSINTSRWSSFALGTSTISQSGGSVTATLPDNTAGSNYAGYDSVASYNLTSSSLFLQVFQVANTATNAQTYFKLSLDSNNYLQFIQQNGTLSAQISVAGSLATLASTPYDPINHQWWRIREAGDSIFFDVSTDGIHWNNVTSQGSSFAITALFIEFAAGTFQSEASPGSAIFDNFNSPPTLTSMNAVNVANASGDDGDYFIAYGSQYIIQEFQTTHQNNIDNISMTWKGRSTDGANESTVYLQIFNVSTGVWETVASETAIRADTDFFLNGTQLTNVANYYDSTNTVSWRVYQKVV